MQKKAFGSVMLAVIITMTLLTTGCFGGSDGASDESEEKSYQGEIQELTAKLSDIDATHVLVTTAKERVYLRSVLFDLTEYIDKNVRVFGVYSEEEISSKPVDLLTVTQIDLLDGDEEVSFLGYSSQKIGLTFNYPDSFFEIKDTETGINLIHDGSSVDKVTFKVLKVSAEMDDKLYIEKNYPNDVFASVNDLGYSNLKGVSNFDYVNRNKLIYIFKFDSYFYEVSTFSSDENIIEYLDEILASIKYAGSPTIKFSEVTEPVDQKYVLDNSKPVSSQPLVGVSKYKNVIELFYTKATDVLPSYKNALNFSFTDNGYFYLAYLDTSSIKKRALIKYDGSVFTVVAQFDVGAIEDWKLVSGNNIVYDRPQTFVPITLTGNLKDVEIIPKFRYFESLPLKFSTQYPQSWYYNRQEDTYIFSDKPLDESTPIARMYVTKSTTLPAFTEQSGTITYNVKLASFTVSVSGDSKYSSILKVMAESIQEITD
jgi:hypothetical protein